MLTMHWCWKRRRAILFSILETRRNMTKWYHWRQVLKLHITHRYCRTILLIRLIQGEIKPLRTRSMDRVLPSSQVILWSRVPVEWWPTVSIIVISANCSRLPFITSFMVSSSKLDETFQPTICLTQVRFNWSTIKTILKAISPRHIIRRPLWYLSAVEVLGLYSILTLRTKGDFSTSAHI
jgi:hypothetical protein